MTTIFPEPSAPHTKSSNLPPPLLLLTIDPPLKQYIIHLHTLSITPPLKSSKQWDLHVSIRRTLLLSYLAKTEEVWRNLDRDLCTQYASLNQGEEGDGGSKRRLGRSDSWSERGGAKRRPYTTTAQ